MKPSVLPLLLLAFALASLSLCVHALELIDPAPEEKARCNAQADERNRSFCMRGHSVAALKFPGETQDLGLFTAANKMAIYKPEGNGPFPALVLLHTCGPADPQQMRYWVKQALENGYVAFVVDSWGQRGIPEGVCRRPVNPGFNPVAVRAKDAYDALEHLGKFSFVIAARIGAMGFSHGGRVTYQLVSKTVSECSRRANGGLPRQWPLTENASTGHLT